QLVERFNEVGSRVAELLSPENRQAFTEVMQNLRETTAVIRQHNDQIGATLDNIKAASAELHKTILDADTMFKTGDTAMRSATEAMGTVKTALTSLDVTAKKFAKLSDDTDQVVNSQVTQFMQQARTLVSSLTRLSNDLERDPSKLIYGADQRQ